MFGIGDVAGRRFSRTKLESAFTLIRPQPNGICRTTTCTWDEDPN